ncbi:MAG: hypothetical protein HY236_12355 [Acidobacteria bacterium]|nr:hypothetical protein [Acidobacteriota bacterium]
MRITLQDEADEGKRVVLPKAVGQSLTLTSSNRLIGKKTVVLEGRMQTVL